MNLNQSFYQIVLWEVLGSSQNQNKYSWVGISFLVRHKLIRLYLNVISGFCPGFTQWQEYRPSDDRQLLTQEAKYVHVHHVIHKSLQQLLTSHTTSCDSEVAPINWQCELNLNWKSLWLQRAVLWSIFLTGLWRAKSNRSCSSWGQSQKNPSWSVIYPRDAE